LPIYTKITIDTNVFIKIIEKEVTRQKAEGFRDPCSYVVRVLRNIFQYYLYKTLQRSQYIYFVHRQIDELKRWINTNVCRSKNSISDKIDEIFAGMR